MDDEAHVLGGEAARARAWLEEQGYALAFRRAEIVECLLAREAERWLGLGLDEQGALEDALARLFPSEAARRALRAVLAGRGQAPAAPPVETLARVEEAGPQETATPPAAEPEAEPALAAGEPVAQEETAPEPALAEDEALSLVEDLLGAAQQALSEVALWTPRRQRLVLLAWISRGRALQEACRDSQSVHRLVAQLASWIGTCAKRFWPGMIHALRLDASPADCRTDLDLLAPVRLASWDDVAQAAEMALAAVEKEDGAEGRDERGWGDAQDLAPSPADPAGLLQETLAAARNLRGASDSGRAWSRDLVGLAARARWLRGAVGEECAADWAELMGRLRRAAGQLPQPQRASLEEVLSASYRPAAGWARFLGLHPEERRESPRRGELLASAPRAPDEPPERVVEWLIEALGVPELTPRDIAGVLLPHAQVVAGVDAERLKDRRARRRLAKVCQAQQPGLQPRLAPGLEEGGGESAASCAGAALLPETYEERLLRAVRQRTEGRRAVLVTNRADPDQDRALLETFGFLRLDHEEHDIRRMQSVADRIAQGSYDFVLSATGFQPHKVERILREACQASRTPLVRVNRARRLACLCAIARELGIAPAAAAERAEAPGSSASMGGAWTSRS